MAANAYKPHLVILAEDKANQEMVTGFCLHPCVIERSVETPPFIGGWNKVVTQFSKQYEVSLQKYPERRLLLIIDFDELYEKRLAWIKSHITNDFIHRVFVLGILSEPEQLKTALGHQSYETIGQTLADECVHNVYELWGHELLKHNQPELARLMKEVKPFLFKNR